MIRAGIEAVVAGRDLTEAEAMAAMTEIMEGTATPAQIAAFIIGLRIKGETVEEITGCARVMRHKATFIRTPEGSIPVDTAGTGGDGAHTFNISTTAAFVAAGAGVVAPVVPVGPPGPWIPGGPCRPTGPRAPSAPVGPTGPWVPGIPVVPVGPAGPCEPAGPCRPAGP